MENEELDIEYVDGILETELGYFDENFIEKIPIHSLRYKIITELLIYYKSEKELPVDLSKIIEEAESIEFYVLGKMHFNRTKKYPYHDEP